MKANAKDGQGKAKVVATDSKVIRTNPKGIATGTKVGLGRTKVLRANAKGIAGDGVRIGSNASAMKGDAAGMAMT